MRGFAALGGVHYPHLTEVLSGRRTPGRAMLVKLGGALADTAGRALGDGAVHIEGSQ